MMQKFKFILFFLIAWVVQTKAQLNTILIIADDLGTDYFGFYENAVDTVDVPHIRSLLAKGVRFKNMMANPVCSSTRSTLLTGRYAFRTGVGYIVGSSQGSGVLDTSEITIPKLLEFHNPNIAKANIGKWHLHNTNPASNLLNPQALGYDHFEGPFIGAINSYTNWTKYTNGVQSTVTTYATTENVNNAITWLKSLNSSQPFFLWLAFNAPHTPFHLPPNNLHNYTLSGTANDIQQNPKQYFKAAIQAMDTEIGRLFDSLQVMNKMDSTDVIFIGDNGNATNTIQIGNTNHGKGTIYYYGVNVPCIIAGPTVVNPGRSSNTLLNSVDLLATIVENFGFNNWQNQIPTNKPVDSKSLMPILKNQSDSIRPWAFSEMFMNVTDPTEGKTIRNTKYKLLRFDTGAEELYNLDVDPEEDNNLLTMAMSTTDISNYNSLCLQLTNLLASGNLCTGSVGLEEVEADNSMTAYPNPFSSKLCLNKKWRYMNVTMMDVFGRIIYNGGQLELQDFSSLASGLYLLKFSTGSIIKLNKQ